MVAKLDQSGQIDKTINAVNEVSKEIENMDKVNSLKSKEDTEVVTYTSSPERVKFQGLGDDDSICSSEYSSLDDDEEPTIPDGGWGWVVVLASFLLQACADGLSFCFGLLHKEFAEYFNTSQSKTALIGSLFMSIPMLVGPVMSAIVDRCGCRLTTMVAGFLATISFLLASVCNSIEMLVLTLGLLAGTAIGIFFVTAVVSVAFWFDKRRNFAMSLAACGMGFGTLFYSPLMTYCLKEYGWRSTVIILAGTLIQMCICGAVMRTPEYLQIKKKKERSSRKSSRKSSSAGSISSRSIGGDSIFLSADELKSLLKSGKSPDYILATLATTIAEAEQLEANTEMNAEQSCKRIHSAIHLPTFVQRNEKVPQEVIDKLIQNKRIYNIILHNYPEVITRRKSEVNLNIEEPPKDAVIEPAKLEVEIKFKSKDVHEKKDKIDDHVKNDLKNMTDNNLTHLKETNVIKDVDKSNENEIRERKNSHKKLDRKHSAEKKYVKQNSQVDNKNNTKPNLTNNQMPQIRRELTANWIRQIGYDHHYFRDVPLNRGTMMTRGAMMNLPRYRLRAASLPNIYKNDDRSSVSSEGMTYCDRIMEVVKAMFNFHMLTEFHFLMLNLSGVIICIWFIVPYYFLVSYLTDLDIPGGENMISIIGMSNSVGMVFLGWTADQPWMSVRKGMTLCVILCGVCVILYPFLVFNYWAMAANSVVFGLMFASTYAYTSALLMELIPMDYFTVAYGMMMLVHGVGQLIGPPIGGLIYDLTKSWELTFYIGGIWLVIAGMFIGVIAFTNNFRICGAKPLLKQVEEAEKAVIV